MHIVRPPAQVVRARKREIARRYRAKRRGRGYEPLTFAAIRVSQINRLIEHRHGPQLPDTDDAETYIRVALDHLAKLRDPSPRVRDWLTHYAPWLALQSRERLISDAIEHPLRYGADKLGWKLRVTKAERTALNLTTIGAIDQTKAERRADARQAKRIRDRARRQAALRDQGATPRHQYEAQSAAHTKPWIAAGMSRATWYRARKPRETGPSPCISDSM